MDKKYLTSRLFLISGIGLIICGIIMFCYPFQLQFGLKDGEDFGYTIMTDVKQLEELRYELKSHGVTEDPVSDAIVKRVGDKVYRSNGIVALFLGLILFWAAVCVALGVFMQEDLTPLLVVGAVMLGYIVAIIWTSNYVCVEHNRMIIKNLLHFFSKEIYFSDIEKADIDQKSLLTVTFKSGDKKVKRILGLLSPSLVEAFKVRLKIEI